jgi:PIN domain nuclease of toxin-antitoxin system
VIPAPLLDTHIWLWWLLGEGTLSREEVNFLDDLPADNRPVISAISLWEAAMLEERGRLQLDVPLEAFLRTACSPESVRIIPLHADIVVAMNQLPADFHRDPADRLIVATARVEGRALATRDRKIQDARLVPIWQLRP